MTSDVHEFEAREGGSFRVSLTYDAPDAAGKTAAHTDTYHGHFARLVPGEQVVEVLEFETANPDLAGEMTMTTTLTDVDGGTEVAVVHEGVPRGVSAADNELGTRMALDHLAALVEKRPGQPALRATWPPLTRAATPPTLPACDIAARAPGWVSTYWLKKARVTRLTARSAGFDPS